MNKLYLWLQNEDNGIKLGEKYWDDKFKEYKLEAYKEECETWIATLLNSVDWITQLKKNVEIEFIDSSPLSYIHAQYNPNSNKIEISQTWVEKYKEFMSEEQAIHIHLYHELYHIYEENYPVWYRDFKYKKKSFLSEYFALEVSRRLCELPWICAVYDLCVSSSGDETELIENLERRLSE